MRHTLPPSLPPHPPFLPSQILPSPVAVRCRQPDPASVLPRQPRRTMWRRRSAAGSSAAAASAAEGSSGAHRCVPDLAHWRWVSVLADGAERRREKSAYMYMHGGTRDKSSALEGSCSATWHTLSSAACATRCLLSAAAFAGHKYAGNVVVYGAMHPCDGDWFGGLHAGNADEFLTALCGVEVRACTPSLDSLAFLILRCAPATDQLAFFACFRAQQLLPSLLTSPATPLGCSFALTAPPP